MQAEPSNLICPLCRNSYARDIAAASGPTRLCQNCRNMIRTILPSPPVQARVLESNLLNKQAVPLPEQVAQEIGDSARQDFVKEAQQAVSLPPQVEELTTNPLEQPAPATHNGAGGSAEKGFPGYNQPADPWEEPLPSWEYSHNEYPVLLSPNGRKRNRRIWIVAAIIFLLAGSAIALSMIFLNPSRADKSGPKTIAASEPQTTALISHNEAAQKSGPEPAAAQKPDTQPSPDDSTKAGSETPSSEPTGQGQPPASQGTISLQAMSSPNEDEAKRYAEKLTNAGIPAYVVGADIQGRGRWFRVRVGRFTTSEEAKKYSAEYRQRARTAGINLDLIVSGS